MTRHGWESRSRRGEAIPQEPISTEAVPTESCGGLKTGVGPITPSQLLDAAALRGRDASQHRRLVPVVRALPRHRRVAKSMMFLT
jgi:hypothetical protein